MIFASLHYQKRTETMSENSNQKALIEQLLNDRDAEFRASNQSRTAAEGTVGG